MLVIFEFKKKIELCLKEEDKIGALTLTKVLPKHFEKMSVVTVKKYVA